MTPPDDWPDGRADFDAVDRLLADAAPDLPPDFAARVVAGLPSRRRTRVQRLSRGVEALLLAASALLGFGQLLAFVFGVWTAGAAG